MSTDPDATIRRLWPWVWPCLIILLALDDIGWWLHPCMGCR